MKMHFGKYKGIEICFVPSGYLKWLLNEDWFVMKEENQILCCQIEADMAKRDMDNSHFYEDKVKV